MAVPILFQVPRGPQGFWPMPEDSRHSTAPAGQASRWALWPVQGHFWAKVEERPPRRHADAGEERLHLLHLLILWELFSEVALGGLAVGVLFVLMDAALVWVAGHGLYGHIESAASVHLDVRVSKGSARGVHRADGRQKMFKSCYACVGAAGCYQAPLTSSPSSAGRFGRSSSSSSSWMGSSP